MPHRASSSPSPRHCHPTDDLEPRSASRSTTGNTSVIRPTFYISPAWMSATSRLMSVVRPAWMSVARPGRGAASTLRGLTGHCQRGHPPYPGRRWLTLISGPGEVHPPLNDCAPAGLTGCPVTAEWLVGRSFTVTRRARSGTCWRGRRRPAGRTRAGFDRTVPPCAKHRAPATRDRRTARRSEGCPAAC